MRNRNSRLSLAVLLASAMTAGACSCESDSGVGREGEASLGNVVPDPTKEAKYLIDFGAVATNAPPKSHPVEFKNIGSAAMTVQIPAVEAPFSMTPTGSFSLAINGSQEVIFQYDPEEVREDDEVVSISTSEGRITVRLVGRGVKPQFTCDTDKIDFGNVEVEVKERPREVRCTNNADVPLHIVAGPITGNDAKLFEIQGGVLAPGSEVAAGETIRIPVVFENGVREGTLTARFSLFTHDMEIHQVALQANSIASALEIEPMPLDFGYVPPPSSAEKLLTIRNIGSRELTVKAPRMGAGSDASYSVEAMADFRLPVDNPDTPDVKENEVQLRVTFAPQDDVVLGRSGTIVVESNSTGAPVINVPVTGKAGGPRISCAPESIDFGLVAVGQPRTRQFVCFNAGTDDPNEATADRLYVESVIPADPTKFSAAVTHQDGTNGARVNGYGPGEEFVVAVTYGPTETMIDSSTITVTTNDSVTPALALNVSGDGKALEPCNFTILPGVPPNINFHMVSPGNTVEQLFQVVNNEDNLCLISNMRVVNDNGDVFALVTPVDVVELPGGGSLDFAVSFSPPLSANLETATIFTGKVLFEISNPTTPTAEVLLRGSSQKPCALIDPDHLNFGTAAPECSTRERELRIVNICTEEIRIESVTMNVGTSCLEPGNPETCVFEVQRMPLLNTPIAGGSETVFTMAYRPIVEREDIGSVLIQLNNGGDPYLVTLQGRGAWDALNTDTFTQAERPRVDLLWVIDNSGSMSDEQTAIGQNLAAFLDFALEENIDFQLGVTSTDTTSGLRGRLNPLPNTATPNLVRLGERILTNTTPNLSLKWARNVVTGTNGEVDEKGILAAKMALSPGMIDAADWSGDPMLDDGNAGFLRTNAALSIIFVSDEPDRDSNPVADYMAFFQTLKGVRNSNLLKFHGIILPPTGASTSCPGGNGDRYNYFIEETGGIWQPICTSDWSESMKEIGENAFGFSSRFYLNGYPACTGPCTGTGPDADIKVEVDGRAMPQTFEGSWVWSYDPIANAVDFNPFFVPEAGSQVDITYTAACQ